MLGQNQVQQEVSVDVQMDESEDLHNENAAAVDRLEDMADKRMVVVDNMVLERLLPERKVDNHTASSELGSMGWHLHSVVPVVPLLVLLVV